MAEADGLDRFFTELSDATEPVTADAPSSLKARIYSAVVRAAEAEQPLCTLSESKAAGGGLCVFEEIVRIAPVGAAMERVNWCRFCHARVLAEHFDNAPIYWPNCPYVDLQNR